MEIYDQIFQGKYNEETFNDVFLLRVNSKYLENVIATQDLLSKQKSLHVICSKCLDFMKDEIYNRKFNSTLTFCIIFKSLFKRLTSFSDLISMICPFKDSDAFFKNLLETLPLLLSNDDKALSQITLVLIVILLSNDVPASNVVMEYFLMVDLFPPLMNIFADSKSTIKMKNNSLICLTLLLRKKPYLIRFEKIKEYKELRDYFIIRFSMMNKNYETALSEGGYLQMLKNLWQKKEIHLNYQELSSTMIMFYEFVKSEKKLTLPLLQEYLKFLSIYDRFDDFYTLNLLSLQILLENELFYDPKIKLTGFQIYHDQTLSEYDGTGCLSQIVMEILTNKKICSNKTLDLIQLFLENVKKTRVKLVNFDWHKLWNFTCQSTTEKNMHKVVAILNFAMLNGNDFLENPQDYHLIFVEILKSTILKTCTDVNISSVFQTFGKEMDLKFGRIPHNADILEIVTSSFDTLPLKRVVVSSVEKYIENPNHNIFFNQLFKSYISQVQIKIKESF